MRTWRARAVWTGSTWLEDATVVCDDGVVVEVREGRAGDGPVLDGVITPGFVNAHCHLELSWAHGRVPGGEGLPAWVGQLFRTAKEGGMTPDAAARSLRDAGTVAVCDIHNGPSTHATIAQAGLIGIAQHEVLGMDRGALAQRIVVAADPIYEEQGVWRRSCPHAVYSTPDELIAVAARPGPVPATIHVCEDPAELAFTSDGTGPFADFLDRLGRDWSWYEPPGTTPIGALDALGVLGRDLLLVHAVHLSADDRQRIARSGAVVCLCPRSNLHIGGQLPDVPALLAAGIPLALGTDSLGSSPDLDVLGEVAVLRERYPDIPMQLWLQAATVGGADALRLPCGRIEVGADARLLALHGARMPEDVTPALDREWLT